MRARLRGRRVRYLLLMAEADHYAKWDRADEAQRQRVVADFRAFTAAVQERGSIVAGEALAHPDLARTVRPGEPGDRAVTDGPYAESVEQVGGFYLLDLPVDEDPGVLAALLPREYAVEVRPVVEVDL